MSSNPQLIFLYFVLRHGYMVTFKEHAVDLTKCILDNCFYGYSQLMYFSGSNIEKKYYANEHSIILGLKLAT